MSFRKITIKAEEAEVSDIFKRTETLCKILDIEISVIILSSHLSFEHQRDSDWLDFGSNMQLKKIQVITEKMDDVELNCFQRTIIKAELF